MARIGRKVTQRQVALAAGVSEAAVSTVLSGQASQRRIAPETVELVRHAVAKLNYQVSQPVAGSKQNHVIGVILKDRVQYALSNPYYGEIFQGVEEVLEKEDFSISIAKADGNFQSSRVARQFAQKKVDGLIMLGELSADNLRWLQQFKMNMVSVNFTAGPTVASVGFDFRASRLMAMEYLASRGHHRVAYLSSSLGTQNSREEEEGYRLALRKPNEPIVIYAKGGDISDAHEAIAEYLKKQPKRLPFTALLGESDTLSAGAIMAFREHGLDVPRDISVMGGQDFHLPGQYPVPLTTTSLDKIEMGRVAARQLLSTIRGESAAAVRIVMPMGIIERASVAAI